MSFQDDQSQAASHSSAGEAFTRETSVSVGQESAAVSIAKANAPRNGAPPPLVPVEVVLRNFSYMPLDVVRLRNSDMAAQEEPAICWFALLLWSAAWHQTPAASLPDDDRVLAGLTGFGRDLKAWKKVRRGTLRGWVKCADGRIYHPVIAAIALEAYEKKLNFQFKTELARIKKSAQRGGFSPDYPKYDEWLFCYRQTGCPQFLRLGTFVPPFVPRDILGTSENVPAVHPSKGKERKGKEERALASNITESGKISRVAETLTRVLREKGYSECASNHPDVVAMAEQGITEGEVAEAAKAGRGLLGGLKGLTWIRRRVEGRRDDAANRGEAPPAVPVDPRVVAIRDADRKLEDRLIELRHFARLGTLDHGELLECEADARATHARQMAGLVVAP